ncbi:hypothetical protein [Thermosulfuriphilus sp.]
MSALLGKRILLKLDFRQPDAFLGLMVEGLNRREFFVATDNLLPPGTKVTLELLLPLDFPPLKVKGQVEWHTKLPYVRKRRPGIGIRLEPLSPIDLELLETISRRLRKEDIS